MKNNLKPHYSQSNGRPQEQAHSGQNDAVKLQ